MLPYVSIIIPTYNRSALLKQTINSFLNINYPKNKYEIIISDNNSKDGTKYTVSKYKKKFSSVKYIFIKEQGVHHARNYAAKIAKGDILYFTDDDMIATKNILLELINIFKKDKRIAVTTGLILPKFETDPPMWIRKHLINFWLSLTDPQIKKKNTIISNNDFGIFSCHQAIKKDIFFRSGGFNPENTAGIWMGDGETGLNIKIQKLGYKFAYTKKSVIFHCIGQSRLNFNYLFNRVANQAYCDSYTFYRKHRDKRKIFFFLIFRTFVSAPLYLFYLFIKAVFQKTSYRFFFCYIKYYLNRNKYDFKLYNDYKFRKLAEIDNWLNFKKYKNYLYKN
jgi:glycosyltransferase involved in cell wall biosynthesis